MRKILIAAFSLLATIGANAYTTKISQTGMKPTDSFGFSIETQAINCKANNTTANCRTQRKEVEGLPMAKFTKYMDKFKSDPKSKLIEFTLSVNQQKIPSCVHLEKKMGNTPMHITAIVTPTECK